MLGIVNQRWYDLPEATLLTIPYSLNQARSVHMQTIVFDLPEGTMNLDDEIRQQIAAYLAGVIDADALFGFLVSCTPDVTSSSDAALRKLWGTAMGALSELSSGETTELSVYSELGEFVSPQPTGRIARFSLTFERAAFELPVVQSGAAFGPMLRTSSTGTPFWPDSWRTAKHGWSGIPA